MRKRAVFGAMLGVAVITAVAWAALTPEQTKQAEGLIAQFGAAEDRTFTSVQLAADAPGEKAVEARGQANVVLIEKRVKDLGPLAFDEEINYVTISPTGERLAYRLRHQKKDYLICDGKPGRAYDSVSEIVFSPDGSRLACYMRDHGQFCVLCDGKEGPPYEFASSFVFSPDSRRFAYQASAGGREGSTFIVCDGKRAYPSYQVTEAVFSPDSLHLAFGAKERLGGNWFIVCDGQRLAGWEGAEGYNTPVFSPDSRRLVFWAGRKGSRVFLQAVLHEDKWVVEPRQDEGPTYEDFGAGVAPAAAFSPDGNHLAAVVRSGGKAVMILDGKTVGTFDSIGGVQFSPDSRRLAYMVTRKTKWEQFMVCDGQEGPVFDLVGTGVGRLVFSPDSRHLAYIGIRDAQKLQDGSVTLDRGYTWQVMCDGRAGPVFIGPAWRKVWPRIVDPQQPVFSPDSRHLAHLATHGDRQFVAIDGVEGPEHFFVKIPERPCEVEGKFRYVVGDGKEAWLVEVGWPKDVDWTNGLKDVEPGEE